MRNEGAPAEVVRAEEARIAEAERSARRVPPRGRHLARVVNARIKPQANRMNAQ
jgi:hypothetical protein